MHKNLHPNPRLLALVAFACLSALSATAEARPDPRDWPMYNHDVSGTRHNGAETALGPTNVGDLVEKWRFPAKGSGELIGAVHATPIVVGGCVYFGTATDPAFYKLTPDGKVAWVYRNHEYPDTPAKDSPPSSPNLRFRPSEHPILASALVTGDSVYFGDLGGWFYALDRETGDERWAINTRAGPFPGAHNLNSFFGSAILADGMVVVGGGTLEQVVAAYPGYRGCTGRGYVMALDPATGEIRWKHDVGPEPGPLDPPVVIEDSWGKHAFHSGPATSSVWCTPSYDGESGTIYFGTDVNTAPRRPTDDNPRLDTPESCAVVALRARDGSRRWVTQINAGDVWTNAMRGYDPETGRYKDQSVGDTPKPYTIDVDGTPTRVVGVGCKNGGFYVLDAASGAVIAHTPIYTGPPEYPLTPEPDKRMLALPGVIGGLQTGCATDGTTIFTNGVDALRMGNGEGAMASAIPPTGGRVAAISMDTASERWRHERPTVASVGGPAPKREYKDVGDPVASGIAVANGVVYFTTVTSGKLVALDAASGRVLKEVDLGPVWAGPSVSRGRVYIGTGNTLFNPMEFEVYFPKERTGVVYSFGLDGEDEVDRLGAGGR